MKKIIFIIGFCLIGVLISTSVSAITWSEIWDFFAFWQTETQGDIDLPPPDLGEVGSIATAWKTVDSLIPRTSTSTDIGAVDKIVRRGYFGNLSFSSTTINYVDYTWPSTAGSPNYVLQTNGSGILSWAVQSGGGGGGSGLWTTTTDQEAMYPVDTNDVVIIGGIATTSEGYILEVIGDILGDGAVFSASSTFAGNLDIEGSITNAAWTGDVIADAYLTKTGDWTGTLDGFDATGLNAWKELTGYTAITPTTTIGIIVNASSSISDLYIDSLTGDLTGNADTATALASDPTDCTDNGEYAYQIADSGNFTCQAITGGTGITFSAGTWSFDCSEVEGTGIDCSTESITLDATGAWTGTFDGFDATGLNEWKELTGYSAITPTTTLGVIINSSSSISSLYVDSLTATALTFPNDSIAEADIDFDTSCGSGNRLYISGDDLACEAAGSSEEDWSAIGATAITPTSTIGVIINASSSMSELFTDQITSASTTLGSVITINNVPYTFPSNAGTNKFVLTTNGAGTLTWEEDDTGGGSGFTAWTTSTNLIYPDATTDKLLIGGSSTTTAGYALEIIGNSLFDGIVATASSSMSELYVDALTSSASSLGTISAGTWEGTAIGDAFLTKTGDWAGTLDGFDATGLNDWQTLTATAISPTTSTAGVIVNASSSMAELYVDILTATTLAFPNDSVAEADISFTTSCGAGNRLYISGNDLACEVAGSSEEDWSAIGATAITPTSTLGVIINASSSISSLYVDSLTSAASALGTVSSGTWEGTAIGDAFLTKTGDWTGTLDGFDATGLNDWQTLTATMIGPATSTAGIAVNASSSIGTLYVDGLFATGTELYSSKFGINSEYFTDLTGSGLQNSSGVLTLDATGDWTGSFDGYDATALNEWIYVDATSMKPATSTVGLIVNASSTFSDNLEIGGNATTTGEFVVGADGSKGGCIAMYDNDKGGWTYCRTLDGEMTCNTNDCSGSATSTLIVGDDE